MSWVYGMLRSLNYTEQPWSMVNTPESSARTEKHRMCGKLIEREKWKKWCKNRENTRGRVRLIWLQSQVGTVSWASCSFSCLPFVINETASPIRVTLETNRHTHNLNTPTLLCSHILLLYSRNPAQCRAAAGIHTETRSPASVTSANTLVLLRDTRFINYWWLR